MRISDWSSDVCSSDLLHHARAGLAVMRIRRREAETFSLSFLDVIACGFGAVILLLIITLAFEPISAQEEVEQIKQRADRKSTRLNSSPSCASRMPSSA